MWKSTNREEFFIKNKHHYYWLFDEGVIKLNTNGEIPFDVLVERASRISWGIGGQTDRDYADQVTDKHLTDFERSVMIAISTRDLNESYRHYIFHLIKDRLENYDKFSSLCVPK